MVALSPCPINLINCMSAPQIIQINCNIITNFWKNCMSASKIIQINCNIITNFWKPSDFYHQFILDLSLWTNIKNLRPFLIRTLKSLINTHTVINRCILTNTSQPKRIQKIWNKGQKRTRPRHCSVHYMQV